VTGFRRSAVPRGKTRSPRPHNQLGHSYAKILQYADARKLKPVLPTPEIYVKGPGMIFKDNPKNYLTEIQLPFAT
jgi:effector-binding domain-containing protein